MQDVEINLDDSPPQQCAEDRSRKRAQPDDVQDLTGEQRSDCA